jgi:hypothetical protein
VPPGDPGDLGTHLERATVRLGQAAGHLGDPAGSCQAIVIPPSTTSVWPVM